MLTCWTLEQFLAMAEIAPRMTTAADPLPLAKATWLKFTDTQFCVRAMGREMLVPDVEGAQPFGMGTLHNPDPCMG